jgi:hypothetical protein
MADFIRDHGPKTKFFPLLLLHGREALLAPTTFCSAEQKRWKGLRPSFSAHVSEFPARGATKICVCGFQRKAA